VPGTDTTGTDTTGTQVQSLEKSAQECYLLALDKYDAAYKIRQGHYPGINKATLLLILAGLPGESREERLRQCQELAQDLLTRQASWPKTLPDDSIWHLATEAEAHFLLQRWNEAADRYRRALEESGGKPFYPDSMRKQVVRICDAFRRIGVENFGPLSNPDDVFGKPSPSSPHK